MIPGRIPSAPPSGYPPKGSIPACAGEPCRAPGMRSIPACAGEPSMEIQVCGGAGKDRRSNSTGSIPACAGEPCALELGGIVYRGLSPRVRGNLVNLPILRRNLRSIPACAGEPSNSHRVYPRVCGGTSSAHKPAQADDNRRSIPACAGEPRGLSPGSIPACAGEPGRLYRPAIIRVYPRVCGGTGPQSLRSGSIPACAGEPLMVSRGSIPACAGEPHSRGHHRCAGNLSGNSRVYPRVCGGTMSGPDLTVYPRVSGRFRCRDSRVYPRVCGGTRVAHWRPRVCGGTRGHPRCAGDEGSIPACAGEPGGSSTGSDGRVYPRVCGGTAEGTCSQAIRVYPGELIEGLSPRVRGNLWPPGLSPRVRQ